MLKHLDDMGGETYKDAINIYKSCHQLVPVDWVHYNQYIRSLASIVANIAEGNGRIRDDSPKDYHHFLYISNGSILETISWLDIAEIDGVINPEQCQTAQGNLSNLHIMILLILYNLPVVFA